jgi:hypothetical protein
MGAPDSKRTSRKESLAKAPLPQRTDEPDAFVEMWKGAWLSGANAYRATKSVTNPHDDDPVRAAWQAGSDWAKSHPDRRKRHHLRLAHPNRRATDAGRRVPRAVKIGAFGIGLLAASRWVWRTLRPREANGTSDDRA